LIEDAISSCQQIKEEYTKNVEEEKEYKQKIVEDWIRIKDKENKLKKNESKQKKLNERKKKLGKKEYAQRGNYMHYYLIN
jgi:DNA repair ATPase RecN